MPTKTEKLRRRRRREAQQHREDRERNPGGRVAEGLLTQEEMAWLLKVAVRTVERWQEEGVLPYLRMGHTVRFYWPAVLDHVTASFTVCRLRGARQNITTGNLPPGGLTKPHLGSGCFPGQEKTSSAALAKVAATGARA